MQRCRKKTNLTHADAAAKRNHVIKEVRAITGSGLKRSKKIWLSPCSSRRVKEAAAKAKQKKIKSPS